MLAIWLCASYDWLSRLRERTNQETPEGYVRTTYTFHSSRKRYVRSGHRVAPFCQIPGSAKILPDCHLAFRYADGQVVPGARSPWHRIPFRAPGHITQEIPYRACHHTADDRANEGRCSCSFHC